VAEPPGQYHLADHFRKGPILEISPSATVIQGDVSRLGDLDKVYRIIREQQGRLDVLIANAGLSHKPWDDGTATGRLHPIRHSDHSVGQNGNHG